MFVLIAESVAVPLRSTALPFIPSLLHSARRCAVAPFVEEGDFPATLLKMVLLERSVEVDGWSIPISSFLLA